MFALLLVWEIGKPWRLAQAEVDRAIDGVRWYVDEIDRMAEGRAPLPGPVSDIAGWALGEGDMAPAAVLVEGGAYSLVGGSSRGGPAIGVPSTGVMAGRVRPSRCQVPSQRPRTLSSWNASGAAARQRCQASPQAVPGLRVRVGAIGDLRSRCTGAGRDVAGRWRSVRHPPRTRRGCAWRVSLRGGRWRHGA
ncbi:hypothetical protein ACFXNX_00500 [Streptomyces antimycoticus]|uniref:hypothetical protein n=1 Tax=Streptomyces antimycoticus TaxID=68175 RepID=UPI0036BB9D4D